jgi:hypothetical protein
LVQNVWFVFEKIQILNLKHENVTIMTQRSVRWISKSWDREVVIFLA